jgi:hypothetical protein
MMINSLLLTVFSIIFIGVSIQAFQLQSKPLAFSSSLHWRSHNGHHFLESKATAMLPGVTVSRQFLLVPFSHVSTNDSPKTTPPSHKEVERIERSPSDGKKKQRIYQSTSRESRISALELLQRTDTENFSVAQQAELNGLVRASSKFEEPYDESLFEKRHVEFKQLHNQAFLALIRYCEMRRNEQVEKKGGGREEGSNVFFLDGPKGGTATSLLQGGLDPYQCFVANRHESTCQKLRISGGGQLPDDNVVHATAAEALRKLNRGNNDDGTNENGPFAHLDFVAYYFDGCGGYVPHIVDMIATALGCTQKEEQLKTTAIGFSLLGGNKDVVDKELFIYQAVNKIAKQQNMRMRHVLDDPEQYGISNDIRKVGGAEGQTFTTWLILEIDV